MWTRFRTWMADLPLADPLQRTQAATLQSLVFVLIAASLIGVPLSLTATSAVDQVVGVVSSLVQALLLVSAAVLLRRGQLRSALVLVIASTILFAALNMIPTGLEGSRAVFMALAIPLVLAGLLGGRRLLAATAVLTVVLVLSVAVLSSVAPTLVGYSHETYDPRLTGAVYVIVALVVTLLIDRFSWALRAALAAAQARERELEALRQSLETQIGERTATLQRTVDELRTSQETITLLGAPILPVLPGVLVAPLIGRFDQARTATLSEKILTAVMRQRALTVIFDTTGVEAADARTIQALIDLAHAVRLLGAEPIVVGIRAEVAQALVAQAFDVNTLRVFSNLQAAVQILQTTHRSVGGSSR